MVKLIEKPTIEQNKLWITTASTDLRHMIKWFKSALFQQILHMVPNILSAVSHFRGSCSRVPQWVWLNTAPVLGCWMHSICRSQNPLVVHEQEWACKCRYFHNSSELVRTSPAAPHQTARSLQGQDILWKQTFQIIMIQLKP